MSLGEYVNQKRKEQNMTVDELAERSGVPKGTVSKITAGINDNPKLATLTALFDTLQGSLDEAMGLSVAPPEEFSREERAYIRQYRGLDDHGRELVDAVLALEYRRCRPALRLLTRPCYLLPVSAGFGNPLDEAPVEEIEIADTPEHRAGDFVVKVSGDSMLPQFRDGDRVLVQSCPSVEIGEIGIFVLNGESFIKKLGVNELISLNPHYPPKPYGASDYIRCFGRVIGTV